MSKRAIHVINANGSEYTRMVLDPKTRMLCGKPLYYKTSRRVLLDLEGQREAIVSIVSPVVHTAIESAYGRPLCKRCFFLARLDGVERAEELLKAEHQKREALARLKEKAHAAKHGELEAFAREIDQARADALVCLDAFEHGKQIERCKHRAVVDQYGNSWILHQEEHAFGDTKHRCNLPKGHTEACRLPLDGEPHHADLQITLAIAVKLYRREHRSSGNKLIVWLNGSRRCACGWHGDSDPSAVGLLFGQVVRESDACPECARRLPKYGRASKRHVACRFCRAILGRNLNPFGHYEHATLNAEDGGIVADRSRATAINTIDVWDHTVRCALRYLGGVTLTEQTDEPILKAALPAGSFVLEHDQ